MTLVELLVAMTAGLIILAGTTSLFVMLQRSGERAQHLTNVSNDLHVAAERLSGWVRNADSIDQASTSTRLLITGGQSTPLCGVATCWIEVGDDGLAFGPSGSVDPTRVLARTVTGVTISFGLDDDEDGSVDTFSASIPAGRADDVLAVRIGLTLFSGSDRTEFSAEEEFTAALRAPILDRLAFAE
jgi:hypothetical protein